MFELLTELVGVMIDFHFFKQVTEEDINRNITKLKQYSWFQDLLQNAEYREWITSNKKVRHTIGKFKTKNLDKDWYNARCEEKLMRVLRKN